MHHENQVLVWDPLLRIFHWLLVVCFLIAYIMEDERLILHVLAGSVVLGLIIFRLFWGVIGAEHARFSDFYYSFKQVVEHLRALAHLRASHYTGHTPAGSMMIFSLLAGLLLLTMSGLLLYALENSVSMLSDVSLEVSLLIEELHGLTADLLMCAAIFHLAGVVVETVLQKQNLIGAMITGYKKGGKDKI